MPRPKGAKNKPKTLDAKYVSPTEGTDLPNLSVEDIEAIATVPTIDEDDVTYMSTIPDVNNIVVNTPTLNAPQIPTHYVEPSITKIIPTHDNGTTPVLPISVEHLATQQLKENPPAYYQPQQSQEMKDLVTALKDFVLVMTEANKNKSDNIIYVKEPKQEPIQPAVIKPEVKQTLPPQPVISEPRKLTVAQATALYNAEMKKLNPQQQKQNQKVKPEKQVKVNPVTGEPEGMSLKTTVICCVGSVIGAVILGITILSVL